MAPELMSYTLVALREARPFWSEARADECRAKALEGGQKIFGVVWANGVSSIVLWPATWEKPGWPQLHAAYLWATVLASEADEVPA